MNSKLIIDHLLDLTSKIDSLNNEQMSSQHLVREMRQMFDWMLEEIPGTLPGNVPRFRLNEKNSTDNSIFIATAINYFYKDQETQPDTIPTDVTSLLELYNHTYYSRIFQIRNIDKVLSSAEPLKRTFWQAQKLLQRPATETVEPTNSVRAKLVLNPKKGTKAALYHVLRQLYQKEMILGKWDEIASFLIDNVTSFEGNEVKALAAEMSRDKEPMPHRKIDLPKDFTELDQ